METIKKQIDKNTFLIFSFNGRDKAKRETFINGIYKEGKTFKANIKQWNEYKKTINK